MPSRRATLRKCATFAGHTNAGDVGKFLGSGSDGVVYALKGDTVVKVIKDVAKLEQAKREYELHKALPPHPNVVRCFTGLVSPVQVSISLDRCSLTLWSSIANETPEAGTFTCPGHEEEEKLLKRSHTSLEELPFVNTYRAAWSLECGSALSHLHRNNVVHRDLNPDNIFLALKEKEWIVKVGDFGISAPADACLEGRVASSNSLMESEYSAPEMEGPHGPPADVFSFGKVLMAMWHRWAGNAKRADDVGEAVYDGDLDGAGLEPVLRELVERCLQEEPGTRPPAAQVTKELEKMMSS